jgi:predicted O-methyltransferase YrrM
LDGPESQVTDRELDLLLKYSRDARVIVEIGCYEGKTSAALAKSSKGTVYTIDPFPKGRLGICWSEYIAKIYSRRLGLQNLKFIKGLSFQVARWFREEIDFLFIDADHSYEAIRKDWEDWFPKVRNGGIIALHDCRMAPNSPHYLGTMRFYEHDIPEIQGIEELDAVDSLVVFKKVGR